MVKRWSVIALGAAAIALLGSCGLFGGDISAVPGQKIYKISGKQLASPNKIEITVTVDKAKRDEMIAALGPNYFEPDELYVWMALKTENSGFMSSKDFYPLAKIPLDTTNLSYTTVIDLLSLATSWSSFSGGTANWLNKDELFGESAWNKMTGFYLFASDGWTNGREGDFSLEGKNALDLVDARFAQRFPKGQGFSNVRTFPDTDETWTDIIAAAGGWEIDFSGTEISSEDVITLTYRKADWESNPDPRLYIGANELTKNDTALIDGATWDGTEILGGQAGVFKWLIGFETGASGINPASYGENSGVRVRVPKDWFTISSGYVALGYWGNFKYLGSLTLFAQHDFDGEPFGVTGAATYVNTDDWYYDQAQENWVQYSGESVWRAAVPTPSDRAAAVETAGRSTGNVLTVVQPSAGDYGFYAPNRNDVYEIDLSDHMVAGSGVSVVFDQRSDFADGDYLDVRLVMENGDILYLEQLGKWNSSVANSWDSSIIEGWKRYSYTYTGIAEGIVDKLRFVFRSNSYYNARGINIDNVKLYDVQ